jgi:hypothetical protein
VICRIARVIQVALVYGFDEVYFFLIELNFFYHLFFFSHIVKKIVFEKNHVIKFYKVHGNVHKFSWLTWFVDLASFFSISLLDIRLIEILVL